METAPDTSGTGDRIVALLVAEGVPRRAIAACTTGSGVPIRLCDGPYGSLDAVIRQHDASQWQVTFSVPGCSNLTLPYPDLESAVEHVMEKASSFTDNTTHDAHGGDPERVERR